MKMLFHAGMPVPLDQARSFLSRVRGELHRMHSAERRLAEFVLNFPGEIASYSASELAKLANVSNSTITRFIQRLGYVNYDDARKRVRAEREGGAALYFSAQGIHDPDKALEAHLEQGRTNVSRTFAVISMAEIDAVAEAMLAARRVWIIGFRTSHAFAIYLRWQTIQVIENVLLIPGAGETLGENLVSIAPNDCVIVFGLRRRVPHTEHVLEQIVKSKAKLLYITDESIERRADVTWHVQCQTSSPGPLFNHVSVMSYLHLLATRVIERAGKAGRKRLSAIEISHDVLNEL
jgi:DNA-binding MurR/RpiR family transcriptional regulator